MNNSKKSSHKGFTDVVDLDKKITSFLNMKDKNKMLKLSKQYNNDLATLLKKDKDKIIKSKKKLNNLIRYYIHANIHPSKKATIKIKKGKNIIVIDIIFDYDDMSVDSNGDKQDWDIKSNPKAWKKFKLFMENLFPNYYFETDSYWDGNTISEDILVGFKIIKNNLDAGREEFYYYLNPA